MELLDKVLHTNCTEGDRRTVDHLCSGKIVRVKVPVGFFAIARKPYCEYHARWVQGKA